MRGGRIGVIVEWVDTGVAVVDLGGGDTAEALDYTGSGVASCPCVGDECVLVEVDGMGRLAIVGWRDADRETIGESGATEIYARTEDGAITARVTLAPDGSVRAVSETGDAEVSLAADGSATLRTADGEVSLSADGSATLRTAAGELSMAADGTTTINDGVVISAAGQLSVAGIDFATHTHGPGSMADGDAEPVTGSTGVPQ